MARVPAARHARGYCTAVTARGSVGSSSNRCLGLVIGVARVPAARHARGCNSTASCHEMLLVQHVKQGSAAAMHGKQGCMLVQQALPGAWCTRSGTCHQLACA